MPQGAVSLKESDYLSQVEKITDQARIVTILKHLQQDRTLLTVALPGGQQAYTSALLRINAEQHYLLLDELNPCTGHAQLLITQHASIHARLKGVDVNFTSALQETGGEAGIAFYRMALPKALNYHQRRAYYRVQVGAGQVVPVLVTRRQGESLKGHLWDISAGGAGLRLNYGEALPRPLEQGEIFPACQIRLSTEQEVSSELQICFWQQDDQTKALRIGGRFLALNKPHEKTVERFVAAVDREIRKRLKT